MWQAAHVRKQLLTLPVEKNDIIGLENEKL